MIRYFLSKVRIEGFRGINNEGNPLELQFRRDKVNSVFAVNGTGKSSVFDALSYAITGRVTKIESLHPQEQRVDYYCNHFHSAKLATIDLEFLPDDNTDTVTSIRIVRKSTSERIVSSPSGHPDPETFLFNLNEDFALLDYQTFSRFIDDSPLSRGRAFSSLLGLSRYSDMRQTLQTVSDARSLRNDLKIDGVRQAAASAHIAKEDALTILCSSYERVTAKQIGAASRLDECQTEIYQALSNVEIFLPHLIGGSLNSVDFDALKQEIYKAEGGQKQKELGEVLQRIGAIEALGTPDTNVFSNEQHILSGLLEDRDALLRQTHGACFKQLYDTAMRLIVEGVWTDDTVCPLCRSPQQESLVGQLENQLAQYQDVAEKHTEIAEFFKSSLWIQRLVLLEKLGPPMNADEIKFAEQFHRNAKSGTVASEELVAGIVRQTKLEATIAGELTRLRVKRKEIENGLPKSLVELTELVEYVRQFGESFRRFRTKEAEENIYNTELTNLTRWQNFITRATAVFSGAEAELSKSRIASIDSDYKTMFEKIMNVKGVVPALFKEKKKEELHVQLSDFHGQKDLAARAILSESFRNALAISVFLSAALKHSGAPRFVVLDDVFSSFDSGHQWKLMELIRRDLRYPNLPNGIQFIILSHDGLLEKYFDRLDSTESWWHQKLEGLPPVGMIRNQVQDLDRMRKRLDDLLSDGQVSQAEPLVRSYLEYKLLQIIRKVDIPVPYDFAMKDHTHMVANCIDAITKAVTIYQKAGLIVLDSKQISDLDSTHVPAIASNWLSHYETGSGSSMSAHVLTGILGSIDQLVDCFHFDFRSNGKTERRWYKSLTKKN